MGEIKHLIEKSRTEAREGKIQSDVFPGHEKVRTAIESHQAMVRENETDGFLPCQYGTATNRQTPWRRTGAGARLPQWAPSQPRTPPGQPDDSETTERSETEGVPPGCVNIHT